MKHVLQITALIGLLFIAPNSLAKTPKLKRTTIKTETDMSEKSKKFLKIM